MSDATTPNLGLTLPTVGADSDDWGAILNADLGQIDALFANTGAAALGSAALMASSDPHFMSTGMIVLWSGAATAIPTGWHLCDGTNGTPDLRDRFLVGAGNSYAVGATGGSVSQTPAITVAGHVLSTAELAYHDHGFVDNGHGHPGSSFHDHSHGISWPYSVIGAPGGGSALAGGNNVQAYSGPATTGVNSGDFGVDVAGAGSNISFTGQGSNSAHGHPGSTSSAIDTRSPYYALCFIMKL